MPLHPPSRPPDLAIAFALGLASVSVLVATNDMGFVRDEAFYFGHAETYQDWQVRLEKPDSREKALTRKEILATWHNNAEHPPLDKLLFGWSWRLLGRKLRPTEQFRVLTGEKVVDIAELGPAQGFAVGAQVAILRPQIVGQPSDIAGRQFVVGDVIERTANRATVKLAADADLAKLAVACPAAGPGAGAPGAKAEIRRTGCEAVERSLFYFLSESAALRFPNALFAGLLVGLIYLAGRLFFAGRQTATGPFGLQRPFAALAAVGYLCIPQAFWHAHLCTFDTTTVATLFATTVFWHRAVVARSWIWLAAVTWGVALLTKHNALFLPIPLIVHWVFNAALERRIVLRWSTKQRHLIAGVALCLGLGLVGAWIHPLVGLAGMAIGIAGAGVKLEFPPVPAVFLAMLAIGPAILVAGWPLLWVDTFDNLLRWIEFHLHHEHYMQTFYGQVLQYPPFPAIFPWAMTVLTWPLSLVAAVFVGFVVVYVPRRLQIPEPTLEVERHDAWLFAERADAEGITAEMRSWDRLVLLSALWPIALISMPGTPIFGGTKHWMPAFPFLLLIGARGVQAVWRGLTLRWHDALGEPNRRAALAGWLLAALLIVPAGLATARTYNHGAAYFNELVGGIAGAAERGMQRQFWGGSTRGSELEFVNRAAPANASVWFHKAAWGSLQMYQREGWLRRDIRFSPGPEGSALGVYHHQKDHDDFETDLMRDYGTRTPQFQFALEGVPMVSVYVRPPVAAQAVSPVR